jgi:hypothetical protein
MYLCKTSTFLKIPNLRSFRGTPIDASVLYFGWCTKFCSFLLDLHCQLSCGSQNQNYWPISRSWTSNQPQNTLQKTKALPVYLKTNSNNERDHKKKITLSLHLSKFSIVPFCLISKHKLFTKSFHAYDSSQSNQQLQHKEIALNTNIKPNC